MRLSFLAPVIGGVLLAGPAFAATTSPFPVDPFTDVPENNAYYQGIEYLRQKSVLRGYPDGTFRAEKKITRGEFIKLIMNPTLIDGQRLNDCLTKEADIEDTSTEKVFYTDVPADEWYAKEVCLATVTKVIDGYPDNTFKPNHYISFVEAAKITANVFAFSLREESGDENWYMPYVERLADLKAIPVAITRPEQEITRGEMSEILYRLHAKVENKASQTASRFAQ